MISSIPSDGSPSSPEDYPSASPRATAGPNIPVAVEFTQMSPEELEDDLEEDEEDLQRSGSLSDSDSDDRMCGSTGKHLTRVEQVTEIRKEANRKAAQRCRRRKKQQQESVMKEFLKSESEKNNLCYDIKELLRERDKLFAEWMKHVSAGCAQPIQLDEVTIPSCYWEVQEEQGNVAGQKMMKRTRSDIGMTTGMAAPVACTSGTLGHSCPIPGLYQNPTSLDPNLLALMKARQAEMKDKGRKRSISCPSGYPYATVGSSCSGGNVSNALMGEMSNQTTHEPDGISSMRQSCPLGELRPTQPQLQQQQQQQQQKHQIQPQQQQQQPGQQQIPPPLSAKKKKVPTATLR